MAAHLLRIIVEGKQLVLYPGEKVKFVLKSALISVEPEVGSRVYSFRIPAEPNVSILGQYNRIDFRKSIITKDCEVYLGASLFTKAKLDITKFDNREFEIMIRFDRTFYQEFSSKNLKDFEYKRPTPYRYNADKTLHPYGDYEFVFGSMSVSDQFTITLQYTHPEDRANTITFAQTFTYDGTLGFFDLVINTFVDYLTDTFNTTGFYSENIGADTLRLYEYFNYVQLPTLSFTSSNNAFCQVFPQPDVQPNILTVLNTLYNDTLNTDEHDFVFFPVYAPNLFEPSLAIGIYNLFQNLYNPKIVGSGTYPGTAASGMLSPFPYVWQVLYQLHNEAGIAIEEDLFFDAENKLLVYWTDQIVNSTFRVPERAWEGQKGLSILYKNIVPNFTVAQQIKDLRFMFNVVVDYNSRKGSIRIIPVKAILQSTEFEDFTSKLLYDFELENKETPFKFNYTWPATEALSTELLPEVNKSKFMPAVNFEADLPAPLKADGYETRYAQKENNIFKWDPGTGTWQLHAIELYGTEDSESANSISTYGSPLFEIIQSLTNKTVFNLTNWLVPYTKQIGNVYKYNQTEYPHRYLYFRGWQACDVRVTEIDSLVEAEYPFGSYHNYNYNKEKIGDYSLSWNHEDGLINTWWKSFLDFMAATKPVIFELDLNLKDLLEIDLLQKKLINNQHYLFDEIEFEVTDKIGISRVKAFPIKNKYE